MCVLFSIAPGVTTVQRCRTEDCKEKYSSEMYQTQKRVNSELHQCDSRNFAMMLLLLMHIIHRSFFPHYCRPSPRVSLNIWFFRVLAMQCSFKIRFWNVYLIMGDKYGLDTCAHSYDNINRSENCTLLESKL